MIHLNKEQQQAVSHIDGPALVLAGPGSGKTSVLCAHILHLLRSAGVAPDKIVALTFSRKAAFEMRARFGRETGGTDLPVTFSTIHALFFHVLRSASPSDPVNVLTGKDKQRVIGRAGIAVAGADTVDAAWIDMADRAISAYKNTGSLPTLPSSFERIFPAVYEAYTGLLEEEHRIDLDDMIGKALLLLKKNPGLLLSLQERFSHVLIDEFQDCNEKQYALLKLLSAGKNLFAVGDDDQAIYGFRGAKSGILQQFINDHPDALKVTLLRNYRCGKNIILAADRLIIQNKNRIEKPLQLPSRFRPPGKVVLLSCPDVFAEAQAVEERIRYFLKTEEIEPGNIAILFRTMQCADLLARRLKDTGVKMMTIHAAKGLEFHTVFVIALQEGILPHILAKKPEEIEEERRLLYVAMTRAINRLFLCSRGHKKSARKPSSFLNDYNAKKRIDRREQSMV
ncbi:MAG: ATP-dependent helicase [Lachnospiraceae bacterium]|nr:ATP-dependent helicase [Lachnospiraceae bacterium]